jgi:hypothetical protein
VLAFQNLAERTLGSLLEVARMNNSKLLGICVTALACTAWWTGCSGSSADGVTTADAGGGGTDGSTAADGGGSDGSSAADAAKDTGVDAALTGAFATITYGSCPTFTACGGDVKGTWNVSGGCVSSDLFKAAKQQCPGIVESNVVFQARGYVTADATTVTRNTEVKFTAKLAIPSNCKAAVGACATVGSALVFAGLKTATCTDDAGTGGCNCDVGDTIADTSSDAYVTAGNTLTTGSSTSARTFDYCVAGSKLSYIETTAKAIPVTFELTK